MTTPSAVEVPTGGKQDPCKITNAGVVSRIFGAKVQNEVARISGTGSQLCQFTLGRTNAGPGGVIEMSLHKGGTVATFDAVRTQNKGSVKIKNVGSAAFYLPHSATLQCRQGKVMIAISANLRSPVARAASPGQVRADLVRLGRVIAAQS